VRSGCASAALDMIEVDPAKQRTRTLTQHRE
jgi:hypothetical protein